MIELVEFALFAVFLVLVVSWLAPDLVDEGRGERGGEVACSMPAIVDFEIVVLPQW